MHDLAYNNKNLTTIAVPDRKVLYSAFNIAKSVSINGCKRGPHSIVITFFDNKTDNQHTEYCMPRRNYSE